MFAGCGFSASTDPNLCQPIIGGYFPGYSLFLAGFHYFGLANKLAAIVTAIFFVLGIIYLRRALIISIENKKLALIISIALGLSPLTLGFSRFILIEPILTVFSILILAQSLIYLKNERSLDLLAIVILIALSVYFKPTSVIFVVPLTIIILIVKKSNFILPLMLSATLLFASVLPWELRNQRLGNETLLTASSNIYPAVKGYHSWLKTWTITEYERGYASFPVWRGELDDIQIHENIFLSVNEAVYARELIKSHIAESDRWEAAIDAKFHALAKIREEQQSVFEYFVLRSLQAISMLLHPANSWGFPFTISAGGPFQSETRGDKFAIFELASQDLIYKITGKSILFGYRVCIVVSFLYFCVLAFEGVMFQLANNRWSVLLRNFFNFPPRSSLSLKNPPFIEVVNAKSIGARLILVSFSLLLSCILMYVFIGFGLEHRYLSPMFPWLELAVFYAVLIRIKRSG
jgi:4-amino-4-deoxy-L-arabinose transferase-like glycosyltransferase